MNINPLKSLVTRAKYLLYLESKLSPEERALHQWQMLCQRSGVQYICGKGGANTCFVIIAGGERELYLPEDFIKRLEALAKHKYGGYGIWSKRKKFLYGPWITLEEAKRKTPKNVDQTLVGICDSGAHDTLFYASKGLNGISWIKFKGHRDEAD
jgi:hypothetical protein